MTKPDQDLDFPFKISIKNTKGLILALFEYIGMDIR